MRKVALLAASVFATLVVVLIAWELRSIVLLVVVSLAVAAMVRQPIDLLTSRRVPQGLATALVFLIGIGVGVGVIVIIVPWLTPQLPAVVQDLSQAYAQLRNELLNASGLRQVLVRWVPSPETLSRLIAPNAGNMPTGEMLGVASGAFEALAQSILVIVLALYWTADQVGFERLWLSLLPPDQRTKARAAWRAIAASVGAYLRSEVAQTLLAGVLLFLGLSLLGVKYAAVLAVLAALLWFIPLIGGLIAIVPALIIGSLSGPMLAGLAVLYTLSVFLLMEFVVERRIYKRRRYGSLWTVLIALALIDLLGFIGLLLAPPLATIVQIVVDEWFRPTAPTPVAVVTPDTPKADLSLLRNRLEQARQSLSQLEQPAPPYATGLMERLEGLLNKAEQVSG